MAPVADDLGDTCAWCGKKDVDLTCSRCKAVVFCGRECQRSHWPGHKAECSRLVREASEAAVAAKAAQRRQTLEEVAAEDAKEEYRRFMARVNKERVRQAKKVALEQARKHLQEGFLIFIQSLSRTLLPMLPPCGLRDQVPVIVCGPAKAVTRKVEPAGAAFHEIYERTSPTFTGPLDDFGGKRGRRGEKRLNRSAKREGAASVSRDLRSFNFPEARSKFHMHKERMHPSLEGVELFTLLGLELKHGYSPSQDEIKEAYRKMALVYHPDKQVYKGSDALILIQRAYEFLSDVDNKQMYESTLAFNDSIPSDENIASKGFFEAMRPVFERNAKWSVHQPVPELGDMSTSVEDVREFYRFWYDFTSWRDVSPTFLKINKEELMDIYDLSRQERREKQKHNISVRKKFEVQERLRITSLVDVAWKHDPRLEDVRRKGRKKEEDDEAEEEVVEEDMMRETHQTKEEREQERELRRKKATAARKCRGNLRKVVEDLHLRVDPEELQRLLMALTPKALAALTAEVERLGSLAPLDDSSEEEEEEGEERAKRKTPKQLAQEYIFEAMREVGIEPTETQLSPEEAEELERAAEQAKDEAYSARRERLKKRREEEKEERRRKKEADVEEETQRIKELSKMAENRDLLRDMKDIETFIREQRPVEAELDEDEEDEAGSNHTGDRAASVAEQQLENLSFEERKLSFEELEGTLDVMKRLDFIRCESWDHRDWREELEEWTNVEEVRDELLEMENEGIYVTSEHFAKTLMKYVLRLAPNKLITEASPFGEPEQELDRVGLFDFVMFLERLVDFERDELARLTKLEKEKVKQEKFTSKERERKAQRKIIKEARRQQMKEEEEERQQQRERLEQEQQQLEQEAFIKNLQAERDLQEWQNSGDSYTEDKVQKLICFFRVGGSADKAAEVAHACFKSAPMIMDLLVRFEVNRLHDTEGYVDDVLQLLADCAMPFFELGIRPPMTVDRLPSKVRQEVKRVRMALRNLIKRQHWATEESGHTESRGSLSHSPTASSSGKKGARSRHRSRNTSSSRGRSGSRRQR